MGDFESILNRLGKWGRYQMLMYVGCFVLVAIAGASMNLIIVFYAITPNHWCRNPSIAHLNLTQDVVLNLTIPKEYKDGEETYSKCTKYDIDFTNWTRDDVNQALREGNISQNVIRCDQGWVYDHVMRASSIVSDWDLVCENRVLGDVAKSVYQIGFMVGVVVFSFISDYYGRKPAFVSSLVMKIGCAIGLAFSPNFTAFIILRFLLGCAALGNYVVGFVLVSEMLRTRTRTKLSPVPSYTWAAMLMVMAGVAYAIRDWRHLALAVSVPQVIMLPMCLFITESPRWLYVKNRHARADAIIRKMAKCNSVSLPENLDVEITATGTKGVLLDILRTPKLRWFLLILGLGWMGTSKVYYFIALYPSDLGGDPYINFLISADLGGDPYINFLISGAVELAAALIGQVIVHYVGRRTMIMFSMIGVGVALLCIVLVPKDLAWISIALAMVGRFCLEICYIAKMTYITELLPTEVRNVGMSACQSSSRIGSIVAPYIGSLIAVNRYIPFTLMGTTCVITGLLQYLLPETKDKKMLQTVAEAEQVYKYRFPMSKCCSNSQEPRRRVSAKI